LTKNQILTQSYKSDQTKTLIKNLSPVGFEDDLLQELFVILLEKDEDLIIRLYENKQLHYYMVRLVLNMVSKRGNFTRFYNPDQKKVKEYERYEESQRLTGYCADCVTPAVTLIKAKFAGSTADAHEARLFETYIEKRSCKQVALHFDIPFYHVKRVVSKVKKELENAIKLEIDN
jgi:hypothetical protein